MIFVLDCFDSVLAWGWGVFDDVDVFVLVVDFFGEIVFSAALLSFVRIVPSFSVRKIAILMARINKIKMAKAVFSARVFNLEVCAAEGPLGNNVFS